MRLVDFVDRFGVLFLFCSVLSSMYLLQTRGSLIIYHVVIIARGFILNATFVKF